jgi:hypothetical protein
MFSNSKIKKKLKIGYDSNLDEPTFHVFDTNKDCTRKENHALCKEEVNHFFKYQGSCDCLEDMRIKLAEMANDGLNVCGNCVSYLYLNGLDKSKEYESCED